MDAGLLAQYVMTGLMLGMMYALVAVGFTLFFGVLDVIKFSHGDVLTVGAFTALATYVGLRMLGVNSDWVDLAVMLVTSTLAMAVLGMAIARYLVMPLRSAPALNTLLITLMLGTVLRESVRLFYPQGANPKPFPALLPRASFDLGGFNLRLDNVLMLASGVLVIVGIQYLLNRTKLGLAIRAVAQDEVIDGDGPGAPVDLAVAGGLEEIDGCRGDAFEQQDLDLVLGQRIGERLLQGVAGAHCGSSHSRGFGGWRLYRGPAAGRQRSAQTEGGLGDSRNPPLAGAI